MESEGSDCGWEMGSVLKNGVALALAVYLEYPKQPSFVVAAGASEQDEGGFVGQTYCCCSSTEILV